MNIANKLTLLRIALAPVVAAGLLLCDRLGWLCWLATGLVFALAAITDALDGRLARSRNLISDFGKLMDPVADKLLVSSVLICLVAIERCSPWIPIIVLLREFLVTSMRMVAASKGRVVAANAWGKAKTITQLTAIGWTMFCAMLAALPVEQLSRYSAALGLSAQLLLWMSAAATLVSGAVIVAQNRDLFSEK